MTKAMMPFRHAVSAFGCQPRLLSSASHMLSPIANSAKQHCQYANPQHHAFRGLQSCSSANLPFRKLSEGLQNSMIAANWADTLKLVQNVPFWEGAMSKLETDYRYASNKKALSSDMESLGRLFDCLYEVEDTRDHINEVMQHLDRATGIAGTGFHAFSPLYNLGDHIDAIVKQYEMLRAKYADNPTLLYKVDDAAGAGVAFLRQKSKFNFGARQMFYY